jgi:hypothetical protein
MNQSLMENPTGDPYRTAGGLPPPASLRQKSVFLLGDRIWIITQQGVGAASAGFGALTAGSATTFYTFVSMTFSVKII